MRFCRFLVLLALVSAPVLPELAHGTTFMPRKFEDTVSEAPIILRGRVGKTSTNWGQGRDGTERIFTLIEFKIAEVLRSSDPSLKSDLDVVLREMGGEKDGVGMEVPGSSHFETGEEAVVFTQERGADGTYDIKGLMMGKLKIKADPNSGDGELVGPAIESSNSLAPKTPRTWNLRDLRTLVGGSGSGTALKGSDPGSPAHSGSGTQATSVPGAAPSSSPSGLSAGPSTESSTPWRSYGFWGGALVFGLIGVRFLRRRS